MIDGAAKATGAQGIKPQQYLALIDPLCSGFLQDTMKCSLVFCSQRNPCWQCDLRYWFGCVVHRFWHWKWGGPFPLFHGFRSHEPISCYAWTLCVSVEQWISVYIILVIWMEYQNCCQRKKVWCYQEKATPFSHFQNKTRNPLFQVLSYTKQNNRTPSTIQYWTTRK